jgi:hypothetical protein
VSIIVFILPQRGYGAKKHKVFKLFYKVNLRRGKREKEKREEKRKEGYSKN